MLFSGALHHFGFNPRTQKQIEASEKKEAEALRVAEAKRIKEEKAREKGREREDSLQALAEEPAVSNWLVKERLNPDTGRPYIDKDIEAEITRTMKKHKLKNRKEFIAYCCKH